jgi:hypothetical protein
LAAYFKARAPPTAVLEKPPPSQLSTDASGFERTFELFVIARDLHHVKKLLRISGENGRTRDISRNDFPSWFIGPIATVVTATQPRTFGPVEDLELAAARTHISDKW